MIRNLYCMKNRYTGIFENPFAEIADVSEYPELLTQSLAFAPVEMLERHKEFDLYCLGKFDSKSGELIESKVDFVCSLEPICLTLLTSKTKKDEVAHVSESA